MIYGDEDFDQLLILMLNPEGYRHDCYKECVEHAEEMAWHFYGTKPTDLLERSRPREDPEVRSYRLENYEPTTKSAADKAVHITSKIFNPNLYSIRWSEETKSSEALKEYTLEYYPKYNSIVDYMKEVLLRKMLADPNAVVAVKLKSIPEKQTDRPEAELYIYGSAAIFNFDEDHYLINTKVESNEYYFEYYDKKQVINFKAYIKNNELNIEEIEIYNHNFNDIPVWQLTGMSECFDDGRVMYKSYYSSAAPYWNLHIIHESDLFGAYITHLHPQKWELTDTCNYKFSYLGNLFPCRSGNITYGDGLSMSCPKCDGSGRTSVKSPYGVYKINKEKLSEGDTPGGIKPVEYINIPTEATAMLEKRTATMLRQGMWAINMDIEDNIGENQSGIAKVIDRSAQYDTLYNIGSVIFGTHLTNAFYFINKYMFGVESISMDKSDDVNLPEINKPTQFDIVSTAELVNNFKIAKDSGLDNNFLVLKTQEILSRDLTTNPDLKMFNILLMNLDPLCGMDQNTIDRNVTRGYNTKQDAVIHFNIRPFVERAIREKTDFATWEKEKQIELLNLYADELIKKTQPTLDMSIINQNA